jgi:AraC-like DNA-binding protein
MRINETKTGSNWSLTIAAGWVKRFYHALLDWGITEQRLYRVSKLRLVDLKDTDKRIPFEQYMQLGQTAQQLTGTPEIGLILGQRARFQDIGIVFQLAYHCSTVRDSLQQTVRYSNLGNEVATAVFVEDDPIAEWSEHYFNARFLSVPLVEFECCQKLEIFKLVLGQDFRPIRVIFRYTAPTYVDKYFEVFQAPVWFDQEKSGIVFKKEYLDLSNPSPQPYIKEILSRHADKLLNDLEKSKQFRDKIKKIIINRLDSGSVTMNMISKELNLSSRTVYRRLREEDISYKKLLFDVKKQLAQAYLIETSYTVNEIAYFLGFSEASAFHRAFKRWFGVNPG